MKDPRIAKIVSKWEAHRAILTDRLDRREYLLGELAAIESQADLFGQAASFFASIADQTQSLVLTRIAGLITAGLQDVFGGNITFIIEPGTLANQPSLEFLIQSNGATTPLLGYRGGGVIQVCAVLLRIALLKLSRTAGLLILDESLSHLAIEYQGAMAALLGQLASRLDIQIILVTHSPEFEEHADTVYRVSQTNGRTKAVKIK